ncbi:hypothetical protein [Actinoplanes sp. G11-F43]|uniref:hypothetical protein n=1 Tax=Actinoplanes sp. G11-F43 TaxID=3424130 RepID=UPI003D34EC47
MLRPGGRLALFWNTVRPTRETAETFAAVYRRAAPSLPFSPWASAAPCGSIAERVSGPLRDAAFTTTPAQRDGTPEV